MKSKILKTLPILFAAALLTACGTYGDYGDYYGSAANTYSVTVWTNSASNIDVFVNNQRVGTVTQSYQEAPECGASGCVVYTTIDGGTKITLRGESTDGKIKWDEKSFRLNRACRRVELVTNSAGEPEVLVN